MPAAPGQRRLYELKAVEGLMLLETRIGASTGERMGDLRRKSPFKASEKCLAPSMTQRPPLEPMIRPPCSTSAKGRVPG